MLAGLPGLVAASTSPSVNMTVQALEVDGGPVARIAAPKARSAVANWDGCICDAGYGLAANRSACPSCPISTKAAPVP